MRRAISMNNKRLFMARPRNPWHLATLSIRFGLLTAVLLWSPTLSAHTVQAISVMQVPRDHGDEIVSSVSIDGLHETIDQCVDSIRQRATIWKVLMSDDPGSAARIGNRIILTCFELRGRNWVSVKTVNVVYNQAGNWVIFD